MQPFKVGILSDTHISKVTPQFVEQIEACFAETQVILHAGDLTDPAILQVFADREVHAVHGNMCCAAGVKALPRRKSITLGKFEIGLIHRAGYSYDFEDQLVYEFDQVNCIVYGHTHQPICHTAGETLFINPGTFISSGRYGAPGTYAILEVGEKLCATIHEVPQI